MYTYVSHPRFDIFLGPPTPFVLPLARDEFPSDLFGGPYV